MTKNAAWSHGLSKISYSLHFYCFLCYKH